jgi:hypothetical protein
MTLPAFLFGFLISTLIGASFHLWFGGGPGRLFFYEVLSWIGFGLGQVLGNLITWKLWDVGPIKLGFAIIGSLFVLFVGKWLSNIRPDRNEQPQK